MSFDPHKNAHSRARAGAYPISFALSSKPEVTDRARIGYSIVRGQPSEYPETGCCFDWEDEWNMSKTDTKKTTPGNDTTTISKARLDELVEEATVDCYGESEQISGFFSMLEEQLAVPFKSSLLGVEIVVERIDITDEEEIVAMCRRGRSRQRISILDLPLPRPRPAGAEWIEAFRHWARWR
jgi:hypothetical protein